MSGGHFNYQQYMCEQIADMVDRIIAENGKLDEYGIAITYPQDIIERFREAAHTLRQAGEMANRIDWLVSSDDSEDTFRARWANEVRPYWGESSRKK